MMLRLVWLLVLAAMAGGCATRRPAAGRGRDFDFARDTLAYANELVWVYERDPGTGTVRHTRQDPVPAYTHHCFVVARMAKQFFLHARFAPDQPKADEAQYRRLVREVRRRNPREPAGPPIVFPGYADLRSFSQAQAQLLQSESGGAWLSYAQRGHWRMLLPFGDRQRERSALALRDSVELHGVAVAHLFTFPALTINHAVLVTAHRSTPGEIDFEVYDPNVPDRPGRLRFDRRTRQFSFPANHYFGGGEVEVYEVYHRWNY